MSGTTVKKKKKIFQNTLMECGKNIANRK